MRMGRSRLEEGRPYGLPAAWGVVKRERPSCQVSGTGAAARADGVRIASWHHEMAHLVQACSRTSA